MKRSTLLLVVFVGFVLYLLFRAKKAAAATASSQPVGTAQATRKPTTAETIAGASLSGLSLLSSMLKSGSPPSANVKQNTWSFDYSGGTDWSSVQISPDFTQGEFSGTGAMTNTQTPDFSQGAFSGSGAWG